MGFLLNTKNEGGMLLAVFVLFSYRIPRVAFMILVLLVGKQRLGSPDYLNKNGVSEVITKLDALPCLYLANAPAPPCTQLQFCPLFAELEPLTMGDRSDSCIEVCRQGSGVCCPARLTK